MCDLYETARKHKIARESLKLALQSDSGLSKVWVVVEGEGDVVVFSRMFTDATISVNQGINDKGNGGYSAVEDIVNYVCSEIPESKVFGIRDKDYTSYLSPVQTFSDNVFVTDRRDLEMTLVESPSVRTALLLIPRFEKAESKVWQMLRYVGYQRIYVDCHHLRCDFEEVVKVSLVWDFTTHSMTTEWKMNCDQALQNEFGITSLQLGAFVDEKGLEHESDYDIIRGHDYVGYVSRALVNTAKYSEDYLYRTIYDHYSKQDFLTTRLSDSIRAWQEERGVEVVTVTMN